MLPHMTRVPRDDTYRQLQEHFDILCDAMNQYKAGRLHFVKPISTTLRVLLHHNPRSNGGSHALLAQLGVLDTMDFLDSAGEIDPSNEHSEWGLIHTHWEPETGRAFYLPITDQRKNEAAEIHRTAFGAIWNEEFRQREGREKLLPWQPRKFDVWWNMSVVLDVEKTTFSRADLVKGLANTDGGTHVDPTLKEAYAKLSRSNSLGHTVGTEDDRKPFDNPVPPMVWQIGWEMRESLVRQFPDLIEIFEANKPQPA